MNLIFVYTKYMKFSLSSYLNKKYKMQLVWFIGSKKTFIKL